MSEPEHLAKASRTAPVTTNAPPEKRVAPFPTSVILEEAIVGSSHAVPLVYPRVFDARPTTAIVSVKPATAAVSRPNNDLERGAAEMSRQRAEAFSPSEPTHSVTPNGTIPVRFYPTFPGDHEADVQVLLRWPGDELVDLRTVRVYGHARRLTDAPMHSLGGTVKPARAPDEDIATADTTNVAKVLETEFDDASEQAMIEARGVAGAQDAGLDIAILEAQSYERQPPKATWWEHFAEVALTMAIGSLAAGTSKAITTSLLEHKVADAFLGDALKEGLKWAGKKALLSPSAPPSSNANIAFFATQKSALVTLAVENEHVVQREKRRLRHELVSSPRTAITKMKAVRAALKSTSDTATEEQRQQSTRQWLALVARSENDGETVAVNGERRTTTKLGFAHDKTRGVLRIHAQVQPVTVMSATIEGVSQEIANRLLKKDLSKEPIPIIILAEDGRGRGVITRDEVGRVRRSHAPDDEVQRHADTQQIVDDVLRKSLKDWGVIFVRTDDATRTNK